MPKDIICQICGKVCNGYTGLSRHIVRVHSMKSKDYYDKYLKKENEGICLICGKPTFFQSLGKGYLKTCSHTCGCLLMHKRESLEKKLERGKNISIGLNSRTKLEKDEANRKRSDSHKKYWSNISENDKLEFKEKVRNGVNKRSNEEKESQYKKISESNKQYYKNLTDEEKQKFKENQRLGALNRDPRVVREAVKKCSETKRRNGTFNSSKSEDRVYDYLLEHFSEDDIKRNYRSEIYPFNCDFYVESLNLYVECNFHWTHGGHWFNENNIDDIKKVEKWKSKNTKYYDNAIKTWTRRDIEKRDTAKGNKLKYLVLWDDNSIQLSIDKFLEDLKYA